MLDFDKKSACIKFEVKLDALGKNRQPLMNALHQVSEARVLEGFIECCADQLAALDSRQNNLARTKIKIVARVLDKAFSKFLEQYWSDSGSAVTIEPFCDCCGNPNVPLQPSKQAVVNARTGPEHRA